MADNQAMYEELGRKWLAGQVVFEEFNGVKLNEKQKEFVNAKDRYLLVSGGFASGKTTGFVVKLWLLCQMFPNNRVLLGRKSRKDVESATLPDILDIFPNDGSWEHKVGPGEIHFKNGSRILFYGLDALQSGAGTDIKKAEQKIKSLNLGAIFIDQLEEIDKKVVLALSGRLRRNMPLQQMCFTCNPANFWAYHVFKTGDDKEFGDKIKLIETSMMDNKENLSPEFIEDQLNKPELYVKRYVLGEWSPDSLVEGGVFAKEYIKAQELLKQKPIRVVDDMHIFVEPKEHEYQIGVDPSIGSTDPCYVCVVDKETGEIVASYTGFVPTNVITEKVVQLAMMYSLKKKPLVIPESTGVGQALIEDLKKVYPRIYERETFNQRERKFTKKLGFYTNYATKTQLIEHMKELFQKRYPKVRDAKIVEELKTFRYSDEAASKGAGAQDGYHDDGIMAMMLAYWNIEAKSTKQTVLDSIAATQKKQRKITKYQYN